MLSANLNNLLATMEEVKKIEGVTERDTQIIESRQQKENDFLGQVLNLANVEESNKSGSTKYSDGQITLNFDDENHAKVIMDLAHAQGVAKGEIVPQKLKDGTVSLHVMPHVFASEQMEDARHMIGLGLEEDDYKAYDAMVADLTERGNPNHDLKGKFMKKSAIDKAGPNGGSRSYQFAKSNDDAKHKKHRNRPLGYSTKAGSQNFNSPQFKYNKKQFRLRKDKPCGRNARNYFRAKLGRAPVKAQDQYRRCADGKIPDWATETTAFKAGKLMLASILRAK